MSDMLKTYVPTPHPVLYSPTIEDIKRLVNEHGAEETARRLQRVHGPGAGVSWWHPR